jgi:four helix bundle protein
MKKSSAGTGKIVRHTDLDVYGSAFDAAMQVFQASKGFPRDERFSLIDQVRRSSRSVCANLAEAWRRRRYEAAFLNKLNECEGEAAETQVWLQFAVECGYLERSLAARLYRQYDAIIGKLVVMTGSPGKWTIGK